MTLDASNFPLAKAPWNPAVPDLCYGWLPYLTVVRRPKACAPSASQYSNDWTASDKCTLPAGAVPVTGIPGVYQRPETDGSVSWWMCSRVEIPDGKLSRGENSKCVESVTVGPGSNWPAGTYCKAVWDLGGPFKVWPDGSFSSGGTALLFQGTPTSFEQLRNVRVSLAYRRWIELLPQEDFIKSLPPELAVVLYYSLGRFDGPPAKGKTNKLVKHDLLPVPDLQFERAIRYLIYLYRPELRELRLTNGNKMTLLVAPQDMKGPYYEQVSVSGIGATIAMNIVKFVAGGGLASVPAYVSIAMTIATSIADFMSQIQSAASGAAIQKSYYEIANALAIAQGEDASKLPPSPGSQVSFNDYLDSISTPPAPTPTQAGVSNNSPNVTTPTTEPLQPSGTLNTTVEAGGGLPWWLVAGAILAFL